MRIGFDARILAHPKSGISTYLSNLVENFCRMSELQIFLFGDKPILEEYSEICKKTETVIFGQRYRKYWAQFSLPAQLKKFKIDIYHAVWNNAVPLLTACPSTITVHDLIPWNVPGYFTKFKKKVKYKCQALSAAHRVARIITNSEYSKKDIIKHLRVCPDKVRVIYYGIEPIFKKRADLQRISNCQKRYNLQNDYIINGGGFIQPRRNTETLIKAFNLFANNCNNNLQLAIVGPGDASQPQYLRLKELILQLKLETRVKFLGHISREDQFLLLSGARMMVLPSLYEGFGLPLIEAMACKIPVVASNVTSIPEIAQGAAILVNPHKPEEMAGAITKIYSDMQLRADLIEKGLKRVEEFSWKKAAEQTLSVYQEAINKYNA